MQVYRLSRRAYAHILSGKGAAIHGGRWNYQGVDVLYTALNRSLAMAEICVHFSLANIPTDYMMVTIYIPDDLFVANIDLKALHPSWNTHPHHESTKKIGSEFMWSGKHCVLKVPSAVTKGDYNILLNPFHPDFNRVTILDVSPFPFDRRLFE